MSVESIPASVLVFVLLVTILTFKMNFGIKINYFNESSEGGALSPQKHFLCAQLFHMPFLN